MTTRTTDPDVLRAEDVAELLQCSVRHVHYLAARGEIPSFRAGRLLRFSRAALDAWMADSSAEPAR